MNLPGRPSALVRALFRIPVLVYRSGFAGFERLVGLRFVLLTATGRRSGLPRSVMLDLIGQDGDRYFVDSGWGERAAWVRNVRANPGVRVQVGRERFVATASEVAPREGARRMLDFIRAHPIYTGAIVRSLGGQVDTRDEAALLRRLEADCLVIELKRG